MSVITDKWFECKPPEWVTTPAVDADDAENKRILIEEMGYGGEFAQCESMHIDSQCFNCGEVLMMPYVYWHGSNKGISLHDKCVHILAKGILRDANEISSKA